jgi:predicted short-subunit dehydrogenase-like oxidoreductase (DUF2520 family)
VSAAVPYVGTVPSVRVIGPGRAGTSMMRALTAAGWVDGGSIGRGDPLEHAAEGVDLLVIATPDAVISDVSGRITPVATTVVAHMAGSVGLDALAGHPRTAAIHPLVAMPNPEVGARRLVSGAWFAVAGDPLARRVVEELGGHAIEVADEDRASYHAAAVIASNHLVALLGQAERVAARAGVPLSAYLDLVRATVENVAELGPAEALTGPAARGDQRTIDAHRTALDPTELEAYDALVAAARRLVDPPRS